MLLTEYGENLHINNEKSISYEEGINITLEIINRLKAGESPEDIVASGVSSDLVQRVLDSLK
jgi:hypothetical protein